MLLGRQTENHCTAHQAPSQAPCIVFGTALAIPFNKGTPPPPPPSPMDGFSVSVPGGIDMLGYLRILL